MSIFFTERYVENNMRISKKTVQERMSELGITQRQLAQKLEVTPRQVNRWFKGENPIPSKYNAKIFDLLDLDEASGPEQETVEAVTALTSTTPTFLKKRISATVSLKTANEFEFIEQRFGVSRQRLIEIAPLMLNCIACLAIEQDAKELKKYDELQLPDGWGPSEPEAQKLVDEQQNTVKDQDAFKFRSITRFINNLIATRYNCGTEDTLEIRNEMYKSLTSVEFDWADIYSFFDLDEKPTKKFSSSRVSVDGNTEKPIHPFVSAFPKEFKEYLTIPIDGQPSVSFYGAITDGYLDISKIKPALWKEKNSEELLPALSELIAETKLQIDKHVSDEEEKQEILEFLGPDIKLPVPIASATATYNWADAEVTDVQVESQYAKAKGEKND